MPYEFYKVLHIISVLMIFTSLGGAIWAQWNKPGVRDYKGRKALFIIHGVGMALAFVAGFGLLARLQVPFSTSWVLGKFVIWLILGGIISLIHRKADLVKIWLPIIILLGLTAATLAIYKI
ncbi:MAG: hypothetical protein CL677_09180 [Bdellovibrionaceae bacterium]|nr:hypothetical protein [Pseudobdellovibrionaceae bacterium]|tara:strand:+ start:2708 stop:3070 length:363 start_codon:yes stop_codon:yes gene_type:complete